MDIGEYASLPVFRQREVARALPLFGSAAVDVLY